jgi:4-amino-4-deoxy-L-arabinose transferase-like glycosyltransferase
MKLKIERYVLIILNLIILGLIMMVSLNTMKYAQINPDGSYYLSYTEKIYQGYRLYSDMGLDYTPLVIYIFLFFKKLYSSIQYEHFLLIQFLSYALSGFLIYKILRYFIINKALAFTAGVVFISSIFAYDGIYIILEPYLIIFSLCTVYFLLIAQQNSNNKYYFFSGLLSICCFLCKQYGLLIYPPIIVFLLFNYWQRKLQLKSLLFFGAGLASALGLFLLLLFLFQNVLPTFFYKSVFKPSYLNSYPNFEIGLTFSFFKYAVFGVFPILFVLPFYLYFYRKGNQFISILLLIMICMSFSIILFIKQFPHYFQLTLPFIIIIITVVYDKSRTWQVYGISLFPIVSLLTLVTCYNSFKRLKDLNQYIIESQYIKNNQLADAKLINSIIPKRTPTTNLSAIPSFSYLCDINAPDFKKEGFNFYYINKAPFNTSADTLYDSRIKPNILNCTFVITDSITYKSFPGALELLSKYHFTLLKTSKNGISIWKRNALFE